jgi:hypothetical protein
MNNLNENNIVMKNRRGVILFVVLGVIFVLTILILSYNHLVQGKFNENREILGHIKGMKCAQSVARFIVEKMKADLKDVNSVEKDSPGNILRTTVFIENDPKRLSEQMQKAWLDKLNLSELIQKLLDTKALKKSSFSTSILFEDIVFLQDKKEEGELFLNFEKAGKMKVIVEVRIGNAREEWIETRPFRVIVPYPMPLTKFNLYLRQATDNLDPVKFNRVKIESASTGRPAGGSPRPFVLRNGMQGKNFNLQDEIWKKRGWIYLGGGNVLLNRAAGGKNYGQRYHSYFPEANMPIALILQFANFNPLSVGSKMLGFRMARWGFSESLFKGSAAGMWKKILKAHIKARPPNKEKEWWQSSCLHLFGALGSSVDDIDLSITRVCGNVYDRFLEIGYLSPDQDGEQPIGAVVSLGKTEFNQTTGKQKKGIIKKIKDGASSFITDTWVDKNLIYLPSKVQDRLGVPDLREMESFFQTLPYSGAGNAITYDKIMSRTDYTAYHETYDLIAQYCQTPQNINIPPLKSVPNVDDLKFQLKVMGLDTQDLDISEIAPESSTSLGMDKRVCYEIKAGEDESVVKLLNENFCNPDNNDFRLGNSVVRIVTDNKGLRLKDNLGSETGGMIMVDGSLEIGTFRKTDTPEKAPLVFMSEKGFIRVKNNGQHPVLGYLIALDKNKGEIKTADNRASLNLIGGIAAHKLDPDQIKGGGNLYYNQSLDPTSDLFGRYLGVVIGPAGGD